MKTDDKKIRSELAIWQPFRWVSNIIDELVLPNSMKELDVTCPLCDLLDHETFFELRLEVPGIKKEDLDIEVGEDSVEICSEHKDSAEETETTAKVIRKEQYKRSYYRKLQMPAKIISDKVEANLDHGILTLRLPKKEPKIEQKKIKITIN